jgi:transporter family protein
MPDDGLRWVAFGAGAAISLALADFSVKLAANRISSGLGAVIYGVCTLTIGLIWLYAGRANGQQQFATREGLLAAIAVGIAFSFVTIFLYLTFATGVDISRAVPAIRITGILMASLLGIILLREGLSLRYLIGLVVALAGIYLLVTST